MYSLKISENKIKCVSKTLNTIKKIRNPDNNKENELKKILNSLNSHIIVEHMVKGKVFEIKYKDKYYYTNWDKPSKYIDVVVKNIFYEINQNILNLNDAVNNIWTWKKEVIKEMILNEIVNFEDDFKLKWKLNNHSICELLEKYYNKPIENLDRIYNNFLWIYKWQIFFEEKLTNISEDVSLFWNLLNNWEKEIWAYFITIKVKEYCHSFVKIDEKKYECIYSYLP